MLLSILNGSVENAPSLLGPSVHSGPGFYLIVFLVILLGAVFVITPVPENTLLFLAGALAVSGPVSLGWVLAASIAGAYAGYDLNYWTGRLLNVAVCRRFCPHILQTRNIEKARALMERFGPVSVVISRFIPGVNLPPFFAGLDSMDYSRYMMVNLVGAVLWCGITVLLGYTIGSLDIIQDYANLLFDLAILVTIATLAYAVILLVRARGETGESPA
ncbi:MAG TPA: DedA family protein [Methanomicrobiales archaeon]|jgi:membrane-associated protein|nr:DedA family protein [Methanomicrobiales archaeon]